MINYMSVTKIIKMYIEVLKEMFEGFKDKLSCAYGKQRQWIFLLIAECKSDKWLRFAFLKFFAITFVS